MINLPSYTWRGKTYKNCSTLTKAVLKKYPDFAVSFDRDFMYLRRRDGYLMNFARTFDANGNSVIADKM